MTPANGKYRVRVVIYDDENGSHDEPITYTDEPLFADPQEIATQALRTQRHFLQDLANNQ